MGRCLLDTLQSDAISFLLLTRGNSLTPDKKVVLPSCHDIFLPCSVECFDLARGVVPGCLHHAPVCHHRLTHLQRADCVATRSLGRWVYDAS